MAELSLVLSERLGDAELDSLLAELRVHLSVGEPRYLLRKSADPNLASVIQLVGSVLAWLPLSAAATAYFASLGKHAGDATWNRLTRSRRREEAKPVSELATALAKATDRMGSNTEVVIGLDVPDGPWGTKITIKNPGPEEVARVLGAFVAHVEQLAKEVQAAVDEGGQPRGPVVVELDSNGDLVATWRARAGESSCTIRIRKSAATDSVG